MQHAARENPKSHPGEGTGVDIRSCSCKDEYQDAKYGAGMRVMNRARDCWHCTVCGAKPAAVKPLKAA